ncbi:MAG: peptide MFS transporter [Alphaproteobacteria bacterium]|nr:peptide MFS transporter [Alphaproteobacteria bacterium]
MDRSLRVVVDGQSGVPWLSWQAPAPKSSPRNPDTGPFVLSGGAAIPDPGVPNMTDRARLDDQHTLLGHPTGLYVLFFAEMWERFSYYGMRALLVFYMIKGFLGYNDNDAYAVYGAYTALVYATPFIGGILADRLLGQRKAVILGGALMAAGHLLMTIEQDTIFFGALALLICGNGFFKPNISTIVGSLYPQGSARRDSGFTLFYIGINLGAAMSGLLCGYVGETFGWHYGFGLATVGMLVGLAVFWAPTRLAQALIGGTGLLTAGAMFTLEKDPISLAINALVGTALMVSAGIAVAALNRGGLPDWAGLPKDPALLKKKVLGPLNAEWAVYLGTFLAVPLIALLVQRNTLAGILLSVIGVVALASLLLAVVKSSTVERQRMFVIMVLMFFSMLFWAFFEQAGSSINNFTDRNVDRVFEERVITQADVGQTVSIPLNQGQVGLPWGGPGLDGLLKDLWADVPLEEGEAAGLPEDASALLVNGLTTITANEEVLEPEQKRAQAETRSPNPTEVAWTVKPEHVGMKVGGTEIRATKFQSANPIFIMLFGLVFSMLWVGLGKLNLDPPIPVKFGLGLLQLGLGFGALWYGCSLADERGMVGMGWLVLGYLLHTTGELCLSPVGLSMVTKLAPGRIVSMVMGAWFLATAFSAYLAGLIAMLTGAEHGGDGPAVIPPPQDTVGVFGEVFGQIAIAAIISSVIVFALSPILTKWMHMEVLEEEAEGAAAGGH